MIKDKDILNTISGYVHVTFEAFIEEFEHYRVEALENNRFRFTAYEDKTYISFASATKIINLKGADFFSELLVMVEHNE